ncbi:MAG: DedA family protein [Oscillospiraceae bacterium]|jgi:membrane protein DedA with SNARE-associated domain|nr:DedA family protein [Oscillospiraceae bacterium]
MNLDWAIVLLERYGALGIFVVTALEYACLPMPSEVLLPMAGLAAAAAGLPLALVAGVTVLAGLTGSAICYALGALGGRPLMDRLLRRFPKAASRLEAAAGWQARVGGLSVMLARVVPVFRTWVSFAAGIARQPFGSFMLYSGIGIIVWNTVLLSAGYYVFLSGVAMQAQNKLWILPVAGMCITMLLALVRLLRRKKSGANA